MTLPNINAPEEALFMELSLIFQVKDLIPMYRKSVRKKVLNVDSELVNECSEILEDYIQQGKRIKISN